MILILSTIIKFNVPLRLAGVDNNIKKGRIKLVGRKQLNGLDSFTSAQLLIKFSSLKV